MPLDMSKAFYSIHHNILFYKLRDVGVPRNCFTECYVDDTKIYMSFNVKDCDDAVAAVNEDLHNIRNWCFQNGLLLNPEKSKLIVYRSRQMLEKLPEFHISLLGKELVPDFVKDFDKYLTFNEHTINTVSSCISTLAQISRVYSAANDPEPQMIPDVNRK